mmetsp:Transcript_14586/g.29181  ORF Transcript_14586/g.29181 Transcript_14586/m.29181 type:complete len:181 (+) Transcript_14586:22-564(+)|eukprot:CAMPEP_0181308042 /NCGR_PEP_ID=MMETSP1101-20121128/11230_1 /TAXON_ID=46948 /ORGANISM="Rhodomonas abbreviata, Strain Caron Lab Isolate" /LENGTH=180 /DNA_ID=CAMNT_0023414355 /DNA_START=13 /DNA_END=555 /DNA_ORIENTATION=+
MARTLLLLVAACCHLSTASADRKDDALRGMCSKPVEKDLRFGVGPDWEMANTICCHNTQYAEPSGYFRSSRVNLFARFKPEESSHTFYDSVCGIPLFVAPRGRTMQEWMKETYEHGWPSFREEEVVHQHIVTTADGEVRSICGTHLGHNIPDNDGDRYCIDLTCIAGQPPSGTQKEPHYH